MPTKNTEQRKAFLQSRGLETWTQYLNQCAIRRGFQDVRDYEKARLQRKGFDTHSDYKNELAKRKGFTSNTEYRRFLRNKAKSIQTPAQVDQAI